MVLALRYLHCDKGIVHRDLTPNNIMLGDYDKVTLSKYIPNPSQQTSNLIQMFHQSNPALHQPISGCPARSMG